MTQSASLATVTDAESSLVIETAEQWQALLAAHPRLLITTYRGDWCPFCKSYLKQLQKQKSTLDGLGVTVMGFSAQSLAQNQRFQQKTKIDYDIYSDLNLLLHKEYQVPISTTHFQAKKYAAGGFLQPSVLLFKDGELAYAWRQDPKMLNFGGAISRLSVSEVIAEAQRVFG